MNTDKRPPRIAWVISAAMRLLQMPGKEDIELIKRNQTLNWWQKWKLIRQIKTVFSNGIFIIKKD